MSDPNVTPDTPTVERPDSAPPRGVVPAFDAGWDAHATGIGRASMVVLAADREWADHEWALLGWDCRRTCVGLAASWPSHDQEQQTDA